MNVEKLSVADNVFYFYLYSFALRIIEVDIEYSFNSP